MSSFIAGPLGLLLLLAGDVAQRRHCGAKSQKRAFQTGRALLTIGLALVIFAIFRLFLLLFQA